MASTMMKGRCWTDSGAGSRLHTQQVGISSLPKGLLSSWSISTLNTQILITIIIIMGNNHSKKHMEPFKMNNIQTQQIHDMQISQLWNKYKQENGATYYQMVESGQIQIGDKCMRLKYFTFGSRPPKGYTLLFGLHGGGGCPSSVNQQQYHNHMALYNGFIPDGVIWVVLRSCEEAPDMWWKAYLPSFFDIIIKAFVLKGIANPNKVFISGYSAGGDGIYHLASMMADWLAGAAMMAGHPNGVQIQNVRNISFSIQAGGQDSAYDRNLMAMRYIKRMEELRSKYGRFSTNYSNVFQNCGHWMNHQDAKMFANFLKEERRPYPELILFKQHPRCRKQFFYYLEVDPDSHKELLLVHQKHNNFYIESQRMPVTIYVNHLTINYSEPVSIYHNNQLTVIRKAERNINIVKESIRSRGDIFYIFEDRFVSIPDNDRFPLDESIKKLQGSGTFNA